MALTDNGGDGFTMPVVPMGGNGGYGSGGWGNDTFTFLIILFLFAFMGNGWGNGYGNGGGTTYVANDVQRGFDQSAVISSLSGINTAVSNGFANAEVSRCNTQANLLATLNANQNANTAAMNGIAMSLQNCCCENRAGLADLKYVVATENCADRSAVSDGIRDIIASNTANTQAILDKLCQQEIDAKNETIAQLRTQLNMQNLAASQNAQTAQILADNAAQTRILNPAPIPAYVVSSPYTSVNYAGCGCGCGAAV